jgi:predicted RNA binding protein YcfA (HicA-like mRNA interferase family)
MNPIGYSRLRSLTARRLVRALKQDKFFLERQVGSHQQYRHPDGRQVTVTYHKSSDTFDFKTLRSMIETQARWTEDDLRRLKLIK